MSTLVKTHEVAFWERTIKFLAPALPQIPIGTHAVLAKAEDKTIE